MSTSISYISASNVPPAVRTAIMAESQLINRDWWCESIAFFEDPSAREQLSGNTKLFLLGYSRQDGSFVELDPEADAFMAWRDAMFITQQLAIWSAKYKFKWLLECEGEPCGQISEKGPDESVKQFIQAIGTLFGDMESGVPADQRASKLLLEHAGRN